MDKDYLEKNNLTIFRREFLGYSVSRLISNEIIRNAHSLGDTDRLNDMITSEMSQMFLLPTLKYLNNLGLVVPISSDSIESNYLDHNVYLGRDRLWNIVKDRYTKSPDDIYLFIYTGDTAHHKILTSDSVRCNHVPHSPQRNVPKLFGMVYKHTSVIAGDEILLCALPKGLIKREEYLPNFIKEIIANQ